MFRRLLHPSAQDDHLLLAAFAHRYSAAIGTFGRRARVVEAISFDLKVFGEE